MARAAVAFGCERCSAIFQSTFTLWGKFLAVGAPLVGFLALVSGACVSCRNALHGSIPLF